MPPQSFDQVKTPALILDRAILSRNLSRMARQISSLGCVLRPHVKTHKSVDVWRETETHGATRGITVSTLREAETFFAAGCHDILYAVGMTPGKVPEAASLSKAGCSLICTIDSTAMADLVGHAARDADIVLPVVIELDVDGHRAGVDPYGPDLLNLAAAISRSAGLNLLGVMTHAGVSYDSRTANERLAFAQRERDGAVHAATRLRAAGYECPIVSTGSTPTALSYDHLTGVTEVRAGVYTFFDLVQAGIGVATSQDIAISVLATVIGHQKSKGWVITDAGWMALSRDRGTSEQAVDQGYGLVCTVAGEPLDDAIVGSANQEHGIVMARTGAPLLDVVRFPIGSRLRILPNHACATAAQYEGYHMLDDLDRSRVSRFWPRLNGW